MRKPNYLRDDFLRARKEAFESGKLDIIRSNDGVYTFAMLQALAGMARNDVYPDARFSDIDCCTWSMFRTL